MVTGGRMSKPPVIGIVGGIGSGKSMVAEVLASLGCVVSDADRHAREILEGKDVLDQLRERWGGEVIGADGLPDRGAISAIVFEDDLERTWLEGIIHPLVHERREAQFDAAPPGVPALVIDAPLLVETGQDKQCDFMLFVDTPRPDRVRRVAQERGWNEEELARREKAQDDLARKRLDADFIIDNSGALDVLGDHVARMLEDIRGRNAGGA